MYDGSGYHGWQMQKKDISVSEALSRALSQIIGHAPKLTGCGRTDAGVHAEVYLANFYTDSTIPCERLPLALGSRLPPDIVVSKASEVPEEFNAIGSCLKKEYCYRIHNSRIRDPFLRDRVWFYPKELDEALMQQAASQFVGTHDFAAVRSVGTETKSTVRTIYYFTVTRLGARIELRVCADGFLYNMARALVGTCVYASEGKLTPADIPAILAARDRSAAGPTAPPQGLYMSKLWYAEDYIL